MEGRTVWKEGDAIQQLLRAFSLEPQATELLAWTLLAARNTGTTGETSSLQRGLAAWHNSAVRPRPAVARREQLPGMDVEFLSRYCFAGNDKFRSVSAE
jgi:hypothetical protein